MNAHASKHGFLTYLLAFLWALLFSGAAAASPGAIWTSLFDGATVNSNLYENKDDVYLNGGPNNATGGAGIPDGVYYFMVTDPSGKVLLSQDDIECRQVLVSGGRISGSTGPACRHPNGTTTLGTPVKLMPFADTPNGGGEYKAWLVPVTEYDASMPSNCTYGFCGGNIKTDNYKVMNQAPAYVVACKFNDLNGNGVQDLGEAVIPQWPITATGVDGGTVSTLTDATGCSTFVVSTFPATVTVTEGTLGQDWVQTTPVAGSYARVGTTPAYTVSSSGVVSSTDIKGGDILDIDFGNHNPDCSQANSCGPPECIVRGECVNAPGLQVSKTANPSYKVTWTIDKAVDQTVINTATSPVTANYTVTLTHDVGTAFVVNGTITVSNPSIADAAGVTVGDAVDNGGSCTVQDGGVIGVLPAGEFRELTYTCTYPDQQVPANGTNTATATWSTLIGPISATGTAAVDFSAAVVVDGTVNVSDVLDGGAPASLGSASSTQTSPITFTYSKSLTGTPGTCVNHDNTATFTSTTPNSTATGSDSERVKVCMGLNPTVTKTAAASFKRTYNWSLTKDVDKTLAKISGGTATFNYTVVATQTGVTDSDWQVTGSITVSNPNDWEAITVDVSDSLPGGSCTVTGGASLTVPASSTASKAYTCTFASAPGTAELTNTGTATWTSATYATPAGTASGTAGVTFGAPTSTVNKVINVTDVFNGGAPASLGSLTATEAAPFATATFTYSQSVAGVSGTCTSYDNTATFASTDSSVTGSASKTVQVCVGKDLTVSKTVTPSFARTYNWNLVKAVDKTRVNTSATSATFNYTVTASQTGFSDSAWTAVGTITVSNPNDWEDITVSLSDVVNNGGTCTIDGGVTSFLVAKGGSVTKNYTCTYASTPSATSITNTATVTWDSATAFTPTGTASGTATGTFTGTPTTTTNKTITVTDNFNGGGASTLGTVTATDGAPFASGVFTYAHTVSGTAGSCTTYNNTAAFTSDTASGNASQSVMICVGANLVVSKTAAPAYARTYFWEIFKSVDKNVLYLGGTVNYSITVNETGVADSGWSVTGSISVSNPNNWQSVTFNLADAIDNGGNCAITGGGTGLVLAAGASVTKSYTCTYSANPGSAAFTNTATATWDSSAFFTPSGSASGTAGGAFGGPTATVNQTVNVTDTMYGALGTVTANDVQPFATQTFTYSRVLSPPVNGCTVQNNTATIVQTNQSASATVTTCGLGEHTIGYWQNKNGQAVIAGADQADLGDYLRSFNAFADAPSTNVAAYVKNIIKAANCNGPTCNLMLRAQMLGTALNVYFSDDTVGVNVFGSPIPMGSAIISLTNPENVSAAFGGATSMTIMEMLLYQNTVATAPTGASWYGQVKPMQVLAKDAFDNINNGNMVGP